MDYKSLIQNGQSLQHSGVKGMKWGRRKVRAIGEFGKDTYKVAKMLNKTRYKKRLREAGGDFASYVKQKKNV